MLLLHICKVEMVIILLVLIVPMP
ncbi:hypothetical protein NC652_001657 [Populus alba x Populus x berolinensis]|nr:hypothetical protein NC652_001657 [Populus alba x Populus x berolinensis]